MTLNLGSSHIAFQNYLRVRHRLTAREQRNALLKVWAGQPGCLDRGAWIRELARFSPLVSMEDQAAFDGLPPVITVYRGAAQSEIHGDAGLSWTTDWETAAFFASTRPHHIGGSYRPPRREPGFVLTGMVEKSRILLFSNERQEYEIVSDGVRVERHQEVAP